MTPARRYRCHLAAVVLASSIILTGCVSSPPDLDEGTAAKLQESVAHIAEVAAAGKFADALTNLESLQAQLTEATARGDVGGDREARIRAAIENVRSDLNALIDAQKSKPELPPEPEPEPETTPDPTPKPEPGPSPVPTLTPNPSPAPEPPAPDPEPEPEPAPSITPEPNPSPSP